MRVSAIVPVLYGEAQLADTLGRLDALRPQVDVESVVVIDVPDPTRQAEAHAANDEPIERFGAHAIYRVGERGFGSALRRGFAEGTGEAMVPFMADCSDEPADIAKMVAKLGEGYDVVAGSRYARGGGIRGNTTKQRLSHTYSLLVRASGGPPIHDVSNAFKLYRREVLERVHTVAESFDISVELTLRAHLAGFRIGEIPSVWTNRHVGSSNFHASQEFKNYRRWLWLAARSRGRVAAPVPEKAR